MEKIKDLSIERTFIENTTLLIINNANILKKHREN